MAYYRRKPVELEARKIESWRSIHFIVGWIRKNGSEAFYVPGPKWSGESTIEIWTDRGKTTAEVGDYVIKGVKGEFYPCRGEVFEELYERIDP